MRGATEIAEKLRELAEAIRGHSKIAHEQIAAFCDKTTIMLDGIRSLQSRLENTGQAEIRKNRDAIPTFLKIGPPDLKDPKP
jgi:hypothetical protein